MSSIDITSYLHKLSRTKHTYCGIIDEKRHQTGKGCSKWKHPLFTHKYTGQFLHHNLHQEGTYLFDQKPHQLYLEGGFYCNKLEGYSLIVYSNGSIFEGLFKQHKKFGPGLVTHVDDTQDVGLWDGDSLRRLAVGIGCERIPKLAYGSQGKAWLLRFRKLVPICLPKQNLAEEIVEKLGDIPEPSQLYNYDVRNMKSKLFDRNEYDGSFFVQGHDCTIEIALSQEEFEEELQEAESSLQETEFSLQEAELTLEEAESTLEEVESSAEDLPEDSSKCKCFDLEIDKLTQLCVKLHDLELILQKVASKKLHHERKLINCEECCIQSIAEEEAIQEIITVRAEEQLKSFELERPHEDTHPDTKEASHSEVELHTVFYTTSVMKPEPKVPFELSGGTLPFSSSFIPTPSFETTYTLLEEVKTSEEKVCACKHKDIRRVFNKYKLARAEEQFYSAVKKCTMRKLDIGLRRVTEMMKEDTRLVKKVEISDLLAWNNEPFCVEVLQHCFLHRRSEENVTFSVSDILTGVRANFKPPGVYEINCRKFLEECMDGRERNALSLMNANNINPDVCDVKGNSGILLAAARNKTSVITMLANCGAKIDIVNDEGLTPLTLCILQYISVKFDIGNWEQAFLQEPKLDAEVLAQLTQWQPRESLHMRNIQTSDSLVKEISIDTVNVHSISQSIQDAFKMAAVSVFSSDKMASVQEKFDSLTVGSKMEVISIPVNMGPQKYFFDLAYRRVKKDVGKKKKTKKKKKKKKKRKKKKKKKKTKKPPTFKTKKRKKSKKGKKRKSSSPRISEDKQDVVREAVMKNKLDLLKKTISTLLLHGSNPNSGGVPFNPLFLAVFTDDSDILYDLLKNNADPDVTSTQDDLTCLHIIATLQLTEEKIKMAKLLLEHGADPNTKTHPNHWMELKDQVVGDGVNSIDFPDEGKNALHILCLREDFEADTNLGSLAEVLADRCNTEEFYIGHTPLSLAVLRGNVKLVETLVQMKKIDPHQLLGYDMGNVVTLLFLQKYEDHFNDDSRKILINTLIGLQFNPFNPVGDFENTIDFIDNIKRDLSKPKKKKKKKKKGKKRGKSTSTKSEKKTRKTSEKAKSKKGTKRGRSRSSKTSKRSKKSRKKKSQDINKYLVEEARKVLFRRIQSEAVKFLYTLLTENLFADRLIMTLARFVTPQEALQLLRLLFGYTQLAPDLFSYVVISDMLQFINLQNNSDDNDELEERVWKTSFVALEQFQLPLPEVDLEADKYKVCFHCLKGRGKKLLWCPLCELVYFCSDECNVKNLQTCTLHVCQTLFYKKTEETLGKELKQSSRLERLLRIAQTVRDERSASFELRELEERMTRVKFPSKNTQEQYETTKKLVRKLARTCARLQKDNKTLFFSSSSLRLTPMTSGELEKFLTDTIKEEIEEVCRESTVSTSRTTNTSKSKKSRSKTPPSPDFASSLLSDVPTLLKFHPAPRTKGHFKHNLKLKPPKVKKVKKTLKNISIEGLKFLPQLFRNIEDSTKSRKGNKEYYMKLLSKVFADFNLPLLLLPYACFKDGQVYYSMNDNVHFHKSFQKLNISD